MCPSSASVLLIAGGTSLLRSRGRLRNLAARDLCCIHQRRRSDPEKVLQFVIGSRRLALCLQRRPYLARPGFYEIRDWDCQWQNARGKIIRRCVDRRGTGRREQAIFRSTDWLSRYSGLAGLRDKGHCPHGENRLRAAAIFATPLFDRPQWEIFRQDLARLHVELLQTTSKSNRPN